MRFLSDLSLLSLVTCDQASLKVACQKHEPAKNHFELTLTLEW